MDKKQMSEQDIRSKFITPNITQSGWDLQTQNRKEVYFTAGRIIVRGKLVSRGKAKKADYMQAGRPGERYERVQPCQHGELTVIIC